MVRKTVTLVFCDVADSTPLGERLDPEALRDVWSRYHETARAVLERHGGTIEKFIGDAVMAAFGIPVVHEDDALRAVRAAAELRDELETLNDELERDYAVRIGIRTGVNTGEVIAGDPAQGQAFATGDAVNVAQRLEASAGAGEILLGDATMRLVRDAVTAEPLPPLALKGKAAPVRAWRLLAVERSLPGLVRRLDAPLVGRRAELERLRAELDDAVADRSCHVLTILGEPGVGKSRLAAELVASLGEEVLALEGRCLPYGRGITYWPLVEMVRRLAAETEPADALVRLLAGEPDGDLVCARVLEAAGLAPPRSRSDELYWAVRRLLETLGRRQPVVVVVDDVQWAEPAFLDLVEYLAGWSRDAPILICCLARTDLAELRLSWAATTTIRLEPLDRHEARLLLEQLIGPLAADAADAVGRATGGNPLFLEEMLRMLVEDGLLAQSDGRFAATVEISALRVPETVQAVLAARLDRLEPDERAVLQRAAVVGEVFWWGAVAELMPTDAAADVSARLHALLRKGLVRPDRSTFAGEDGFRFAHLLVRDAAYEAMSKQLRGALHERLADWIERRAGAAEQDAIVGHHLEQSYRYRTELARPTEADAALARRAAELLGRAGRRALARVDPHAAASLLERAVALLPSDSPRRLELLLEAGVAQHRASDLRRARELVDEVARTAEEPRLKWSARLEQAIVGLYIGDGTTDDVVRVAEEAAPVFAELGDDAGLAQTWSAVAIELFVRGRYRQMEDASRRSLEHLRRVGDARREGEAIGSICVAVALGPTHADEAAAHCGELLARAEELGRVAVPAAVLAGVEGMRGRFEEAWKLYAGAREAAGEATAGIGAASLPLYAEPLLALAPEQAEEELRAGYRTLEELGQHAVLSTVAAVLGETVLQLGRVEEAEELARLSERIAVSQDVYSQIVWRRVLARALAAGGEEAEPLAREALALAETTESPHLIAGSLVALGDVLRSAGRPADEPWAAGVALYEAKGNVAAARRLRAGLDLRAKTR